MIESPLDVAGGTLYKVSLSFPKDSAIGTHSFRFHFTDDFGGEAYLPATGYFSGPIVNGGEDPDLTDGTVFPQAGKPSNQYVFTIHYYSKSDLDAGKTPTMTKLYLDNKPYVMTYRDWGAPDTDPANGVYEYAFDGLEVGTHEFYFVFKNAKGISRRYPNTGVIPMPVVDVGNSPPWLSEGKVEPISGDELTTYTYSVVYEDDDGDPPAPNKQIVYIDDVAHLMSIKNGESGANAVYEYKITGMDFGSHTYYFYFEDTEGNSTRLPYINYYEGPNVTSIQTENTPPELTLGQVSPDTGNTVTPFVYSVQYFDKDEDEPFTKFVYIDDVPYEMALESGQPYDGVYTYEMKNLEGGTHTFYFSFTDGNGGTDRLPTIGNYTGPTVITEPKAYIPYWFVSENYGVNTFLFLTNLGAYPVDAEIALKDLGGLDRVLKRVLIDPGQLLKIDVSTFNIEGQGFGTISWDKGLLNVFGVIYDFAYGNSYPIYFSSPTINGEAFLPYWQVSQNYQIDTNLMITNIDPAHAEVNITLKDRFNTTLNTEAFVLPGNSMRIFSVADLIAPTLSGNPFEGIGSLSMDWDVGRLNIWGITLNQSAAKGYPILYVKEMNTSPTYVPFWQVSKNSSYDTFLMINNLGSKDMMPSIKIYDHVGNIIGVAAPTVSAGSVAIVPFSDYVSKTVEYGSAIVTWAGDTPVKMWGTVYNLNEGSGQVLQLNNNANAVSPVHIPYFQKNNFVDTNLFVSNMSDQIVQVVYEFYDVYGNSSGFSNAVVSPHATMVIQASSSTLYGEGRAKISWDSGEVAVWGNIYSSFSNSFTALTFDSPKGSAE